MNVAPILRSFAKKVRPLFPFHPADFFKNQEGKAGKDGDDRSKAHSLELNRTNDDGGTAKTGNEGQGRKNQILRFSEIHLAVDHHAQARRSNETKKKDADATHNRTGNIVDKGSNLSYKGKDNGEDGSTANDPGAVYAGNSHNPHVFPISRVRRGTRKPGKHVRKSVGNE